MTMADIQSHLSSNPVKSYFVELSCLALTDARMQISYYDPPSKNAALGGLVPGDPRSELVFATFHSQKMAQIMLRGFGTCNGDEDSESHFALSQISKISPLAQIRAGKYGVPTFILHGSEDDVVPAGQSVDFESALRAQGVPSGVLILSGKRHLFDLYLKPGTEEWERCVLPGFDFVAKWVGLL